MMYDTQSDSRRIAKKWMELRNDSPLPQVSSDNSVRSNARRAALHILNEIFPNWVKRWFKRVYWQLTKYRIKPLRPTSKLGLGKSVFQEAKNSKDLIPVLFLLPWIQVGGVEQVFLQILKHINRAKYSIYLATTMPSLNEWAYKFAPHVDYLFHLPEFCKSDAEQLDFVLDLIGECGIRVIHVSNSQAGYRFMHEIKERFPDVFILDTLHMEEPYEAWDYFRYSNLFREPIDKRIVITPHLRSRLETTYGERKEKIVVIPNGIDLGHYTKRDEVIPQPPLIVYAGRLVKQKQPLIFVRMAAILHKLQPDLRFAMIGTGPLLPVLQSELEKLGLQAIVPIKNDVSDLRQTLLSAAVMISPSLREGLPMVGLEAMATGVPIVASRVIGWSDLIEDKQNGILVDKIIPENFAQAVVDLLADKKLYFKIVNRARIQVDSLYNAVHMSHAYQMLYNNEKVRLNDKTMDS